MKGNLFEKKNKKTEKGRTDIAVFLNENQCSYPITGTINRNTLQSAKEMAKCNTFPTSSWSRSHRPDESNTRCVRQCVLLQTRWLTEPWTQHKAFGFGMRLVESDWLWGLKEQMGQGHGSVWSMQSAS